VLGLRHGLDGGDRMRMAMQYALYCHGCKDFRAHQWNGTKWVCMQCGRKRDYLRPETIEADISRRWA
jgi:rRNA maturation endonuclease Nob1